MVGIIALLAGAFVWASNLDTRAAVQEERLTRFKDEQERRWNEIREDIREIKEMVKESKKKK